MSITVELLFQRYGIVLTNRGAIWVAGVPRLHVWATGATREHALTALEAKVTTFAADVTAAGVEPDLPPAASRYRDAGELERSRPWWDIRGFVLRLAVILVMFAVGLAMVERVAVHKLGTAIVHLRESVGAVQARSSWDGIEAALAKLAGSLEAIPPEKRAAALADLHRVGEQMKPFIAEVEASLVPPPAPSEHKR